MRGATPRFRSGFTMVELMTTLTILVILITILVPTISKVRRSAQAASVRQQVNELQGAVERFYQDQHQYPGPLADSELYYAGRNGATTPPVNRQLHNANGSGVLSNAGKVTQAENLVLGLLGGVKYAPNGNNPPNICFDPAMIGRGMMTLSGAGIKKFEPYISYDPKTLSSGQYSDGAGTADDSDVPEFVDRFPNSMPILYLRAHVGAKGVVSFDGQDLNGWVLGNPGELTQYNLYDVIAYTKGKSGSIGEGKTIAARDYTSNFSPPPKPGYLPHGLQNVSDGASMDKSAPGYTYPYDALPYFRNSTAAPTDINRPNATGTPRSKDTYILISAGPDRVYGTADDICSFGSVTE